jgi:hypothetical protein
MDVIGIIKLKSVYPHWFKKRRLHVYCLGAAKTGTTSMAGIFAKHYRSASEPCIVDVMLKAELMLKQQLSEKQIVSWLLARDKQMNLDVESSHPLSYFAPWLPDLFPQAKFIISIREPLSWLRSRLDFHKQVMPPKWARYRDFIWSRGHQDYAPEEQLLSELGLYSLDGYLSQYSEQYRILFDNIPEAKRLIVNTSAIDHSVPKIEQFLSLPANTIQAVHLNSLRNKANILQRLDVDFVNKKIQQHCGWLTDYID